MIIKMIKKWKQIFVVFLDKFIDFYGGYKKREWTPHPHGLRDRLVDQGGGKCAYCDTALYIRGRKSNVSIDHMIPVVLGGKDDGSNLQAVCKECNRFKDEHTDSEFRERIQRGMRVLEIPVYQPIDRCLMQKIMNCTEIHENVTRRKNSRRRNRALRVIVISIVFGCILLLPLAGFALFPYAQPWDTVLKCLHVLNGLFTYAFLSRAYDRGSFRWTWRPKAQSNSTLRR